MRVVNAREMREADAATIERLGLPGIALMESAGRGATALCLEELERLGLDVSAGVCATVFCGGGNNGGDGFVIARELAYRGVDCDVVSLGRWAGRSGDAATNLAFLHALEREGLGGPGRCTVHPWGDRLAHGASVTELLDSLVMGDVVVDAMLGTGLSKDLRSPISDVVERINASGAWVLAVDIPTGVSSDTGAIVGSAVSADVTATFGASKLGHWLTPGRELRGALRVVDIGIPPAVYPELGALDEVLDGESLCGLLPERPHTGHKGTFGHVVCVGGFEGKVGAITLTAGAALRAGAGLVTVGSNVNVTTAVISNCPEAMTSRASTVEDFRRLADGKGALAIGPGLGTCELAQELVRSVLLDPPSAMVLDADALNVTVMLDAVASLRAVAQKVPLVLTPHPGEFARLVEGTVAGVIADPVESARELAVLTGAVVVLKMATTVVAHPDGLVALNPTGNSGMGTGGSGDVLTGVVGSLLAQGMSGWDAARIAVFVHGLAGDLVADQIGARGLVAGDLVGALPEAFEVLCARG